ncbi:glycogen synthase GlgA [Megamonas sp.]|uniref:glycogen synthase GlgA n=1 Tax=Megamonas sp. TaxID=2049033 RepID=UPI00258E577B|nr:glycogen synthase GlgA [Megamonas sp.]
MLKVLYVASEAVPFVKTGGLADVAGSLPKELKQKGVDVRVVIPKYSGIKEEYRNNMEHIYDGEINVSWRKKYLGIDRYDYKDVPFYFIDNQEYFYREGYYGYPDDVERFTFFCRAVLEMLPHIDFWPDVIHMNDWQTGLISVYLKLEHNEDVRYNKIKTVYTIHNLKYQGCFWKGYLPDVLGLDWKCFNNGDLEYFDDINFMKGAIVYSDKVTTVSRSYAKEIQDPYYGEGLEGMLQKRDADLSGIINGLDYEDYNPETDKYIFKNFDVHNAIAIKGDNKEQLQKKLGLPVNRKIPMIGMVTRLVEAKGLDLVTRILDELLEYENVQFVILGTGDRQYEDWFKGLVWRYPKKVSANIFFNNELAHQIYAASDLFLMPSQYEPCGIGQLIALRYGTVPIVRATGGLKDTVEAYNNYTQTGNGFSFNNYNAHELLFSIKRAIDGIADDRKHIHLVENAMTADYSWEESAKQYKELYNSLKA